MAKSFGKKVFTLAVISAAAAGTYYYFKNKNADIPVNMDDDEDFDNFADDTIDEPKAKRSYVNLDFQTVEQKAKETAGKVAEYADKAGKSIGNFIQQAEGKVEEFFDDRKAAAEVAQEVAEEATDLATEVADEAKEAVSEVTEEVTNEF